MVLPAAAFEDAIDASLAVGARAIVAITAGLGELGEQGLARERAAVDRVRAAGAVMLGPNCLGIYDSSSELDLGSSEFAPGSLGIISQSGNLALELSLLAGEYGLGVSRFASLGNQADVEAAELVTAFAAHERTRVIAVYCEDFRDGRAFARAGRPRSLRASRSCCSPPGPALPERARQPPTPARSRATRPPWTRPAGPPGSSA